MQSLNQNGTRGQSPDAQFLELIEDLAGRFATLSGPAIAAELAAVRVLGEQLLAEAKAARSVAATKVDLRRLSNAQLRAAVIAQRGPSSAAYFATRLAKDLAAQRGALRLANGGEIKVAR
jgi:hypothetical protein